jgi:hypothetical protein
VQVKLYTLIRIPSGPLELRAQAEVIDKDKKGRSIGSHIETHITSVGYDTGAMTAGTLNLAAAIMMHYYGATDEDPGAMAEAQRQIKRFLEAFLLHQTIKPGARLEISSDVLDRFFNLQ